MMDEDPGIELRFGDELVSFVPVPAESRKKRARDCGLFRHQRDSVA